MTRSTLLLAAACVAIAGCSKAPAAGQAAAGPAVTGSVSPPTGSACDRHLITKEDVAPLLSEPISGVKPLAGDAQSCTFETAGFSTVTVSLRPGLGDLTVQQVQSGATNQTVTPLAGVGDKAVWDPILKEVDATRNNTLCEIHAIGPATDPATQARVGALCTKILAAT